MLKKYDLTIDQIGVLMILHQHNRSISLSTLSEVMLKDLPTLNNIIDLLIRKGMVDREIDSSDRRRYNIVLTDKGHQKEREVYPVMQKIRADLAMGISDEEMANFKKTLEKINGNIDR